MDAPTLRRQLVLGAATLLVLTQVAFRAWALYPSWFYTDDFLLLHDAKGPSLKPSYLLDPFDGQLMPVGRLLAWLVANSGTLNWPLAASLTLFLQLLASVACAWMLFSLFGVRLLALFPLALYLSSAITMPAMMWWAAALNQLPLQITCFVAITAWARYLATGRRRWLLLLLAVLIFGLLSYVKTVLLFGVLTYVLLAWFSSGTLIHRVTSSVRERRRVLIPLIALFVGFVLYYTTQVPQITGTGGLSQPAPLAGTMLGRVLPVGLVGGPWRWDSRTPPTGLANPPQFALSLSWVLLALALLVVLIKRRRTGRAWVLLSLYAVATYLLLLLTRAAALRDLAGLEYRYLTDVMPILVFCLGVGTMRLRGSPEPSFARQEASSLSLAFRRRLRSGLVGLVVVSVTGGVFSSSIYARIWHDHNPSERYVHNARDTLGGMGRVDLADQSVPSDVITRFSLSRNKTSILVPLFNENVRFPRATGHLVVLDDNGFAQRALIDTATTSPRGPDESCGWNVKGAQRIPMRDRTAASDWWIRIGYLAGGPSKARITAGNDVFQTTLHKGLGSLYLHVTGSIGSVTVSSQAGIGLCVSTVEVGQPVPGGLL